MGYYTRFHLSWDGDIDEEELKKALLKHDCYGIYNEDYEIEINEADSCKWYSYEEDMKELSKEFPDIIFDLYGEGEESGDQWHTYFKNGKMQECPAIVSFEPYDEAKLE